MESQQSRFGLNWLNFFSAAVQTGFGPFVAVWLTQQRWDQTQVGLALSIGTFVGLVGQLPGGWLVDAVHKKRWVTTAALAATGLAAVLLAALPTRGSVWAAESLHALASCIVTPAIAAITLRLCGHGAYSERLGVNVRYASLGNAVAAGLLGAGAFYLSERAVFIMTALMVLPAIASLHLIRWEDHTANGHLAIVHPHKRREARLRPWIIFREPALHIFAVCAVLFHMCNAGLLPLAVNELAGYSRDTGLVVSAAIILPQAIVVAISPWTGRMAQALGRRPVLLAGFAALPLRGLLFAALFAVGPQPLPLVLFQALDGVSGAVFGLMLPLIAADTTRRAGHLNLAIGSLGLAAGMGATIGTTVAGVMADRFGAPVAFVGLALVGTLAVAGIALLMPETRPGHGSTTGTAAVAVRS